MFSLFRYFVNLLIRTVFWVQSYDAEVIFSNKTCAIQKIFLTLHHIRNIILLYAL